MKLGAGMAAVFVGVLLIAGTGWARPAGAAASTFTVTTTFDNGPGSLRQAALDADANPGADVIRVNLPPTFAINLATTITSTDDVTVDGNGITVTLEGPPSFIWTHTGGGPTKFNNFAMVGTQPGVGGITSDGDVTLSDMTFSALSGGAVVGDTVAASSSTFTGNGGGIQAANAIVTTSSFDSNSRGVCQFTCSGGGAVVAVTATIATSTFTNNTAPGVCQSGCPGGGAVSAESATIATSTFTSNTTAGSGGAVYANALVVDTSLFVANISTGGRGGGAIGVSGTTTPTLLIQNSTFSANSTTTDDGSTIYDDGSGSTVTIENSTFVGNTAPTGSAAVANPAGSVVLRYTTFAGNTAGVGLATDLAALTATSFGTVFAGTTTTHCMLSGSPVTSQGYNVEQAGASCGLDSGTDLQSSLDPGLGALADNGGPTPTMMPGPGSLLIDRIPTSDAGCTGLDQRGILRPQGTGCDVGSVEAPLAPGGVVLSEHLVIDRDAPSPSPYRALAAIPVVATPSLAG